MRTLLAFYTIANILNDMINDYSSNDRVIIDENEKGDVQQNTEIPEIPESAENITEIISKTHELMDKAPLVQDHGWFNYIVESLLHLSSNGVSLQLISTAVLLPIIAEYASRDNMIPEESVETVAEIERLFYSKYPGVEHLPSPNQISNSFANWFIGGIKTATSNNQYRKNRYA
jgi:hypothetical protein